MEVVRNIKSNTLIVGISTLDVIFTDSEQTANDCQQDIELQKLLVPYLFPLTVEYSVLAMIVALTMWEKCGWQEPDYVIAPPAGSEFVSSSSKKCYGFD